MKVGGILETALNVEDIAHSAAFYRRIFGFPTLFESDRLHALNVADRDVLLLFPKGGTSEPFTLPNGAGVIPPHGGYGEQHFAFSIDEGDFDAWRRHLEAEGVAVESVVNWPEGARSLYFRDPDRHLVELISRGFWTIY
jgi:catechol 2,3-dioxygenase-like lactoylglutathione lyase family enzyme